jgi:hypothetical protein
MRLLVSPLAVPAAITAVLMMRAGGCAAPPADLDKAIGRRRRRTA